jgi:hypothetical protein
VSASEFRRIGTRGLENQVAQHREYQNHDRRSPNRVKEEVSIDLYRGLGV